jgi:hypothetical protein
MGLETAFFDMFKEAGSRAGSIVSSGLGAVMSFKQASEQKRNQMEAQRAAEIAMAEAKRQLEVNYYDKLAVNKEPYELQREAALVQGAQAIQGAQEQERGIGATAGRVQMAQNEMQAGIRSSMGQEMSDLDKLKAQEDSRLRDIGVQINLDEVAGQQQMAADAQAAAAAATAQGWQGVQGVAQNIYGSAPLYSGKGGNTNIAAPQAPSAEAMARTKQQLKLSPDQMPQIQKPQMVSTNPFEYSNATKFGSPIKMPLWSQDYNYFNF